MARVISWAVLVLEPLLRIRSWKSLAPPPALIFLRPHRCVQVVLWFGKALPLVHFFGLAHLKALVSPIVISPPTKFSGMIRITDSPARRISTQDLPTPQDKD